MKRLPNRFLIVPITSLMCMLVFSLTTVSADEPIVEDSTEVKDTGFSSAWQALQTVVENVMKEHLSSPTRQQMYLSACRGLYVPTKTLPPSDLSERFSELTTNQQFQEKLSEVWNQQTAKGIEPQQLANFAINAVMASAIRPLSTVEADKFIGARPRFVSEKENRIRKQLAENQYVGIGIRVGIKDGFPQIQEPFYGGAAQKAGARKGDLIVAVEGVPSKGRNFREIIEDLRGEQGSTLHVTLRHESETEDRQYTMVRDVIPISTVTGHKRNEDGSWALELPGHSDIAYLKVTSIVGSTAAEFTELARKIAKEDFRAVVLDFSERTGNSVPDVHHAIMLADALLGEAFIGELYTKENKTPIRTHADHSLKDTPIVIFAPRSISGPEFFVLSALANHGRAKIVGTMLSSRGLCTKSIDLEGLGAIDQLPYAVALPHVPEKKATTTAAPHGENVIQQINESFTLRPDAVVQNPNKSDNYVKAALRLMEQ